MPKQRVGIREVEQNLRAINQVSGATEFHLVERDILAFDLIERPIPTVGQSITEIRSAPSTRHLMAATRREIRDYLVAMIASLEREAQP